MIGAGSYAKIFKAKDKKDPNITIAVKVIEKTGMSGDDLEGLENEIKIMQKLDHPNIVKYFETYEDRKFIYLCMEYLDGGDLYDQVIRRRKTLSHREAAECFEKVLRALEHCHS